MGNIKNILEGWGKLAADKFNLLRDTDKDMTANRMLICNMIYS